MTEILNYLFLIILFVVSQNSGKLGLFCFWFYIHLSIYKCTLYVQTYIGAMKPPCIAFSYLSYSHISIHNKLLIYLEVQLLVC